MNALVELGSDLATAFFLALVVNRVVEHVFKPLRSLLLLYIAPEKLAWMDYISPYVAWGLGGLVAWYADINLLPIFADPLVGKIITSILIGGGAELLHDIFDPLPTKGRWEWGMTYGLLPSEELEALKCCRDPD